MTPAQKDHQTFEERLLTKIGKYWTPDTAESVSDNYNFGGGARWAREETLREVFGLLRSEDFKIAQRRETILGESLTDWLESKLKEPTVVPKDPSFVLPEYY